MKKLFLGAAMALAAVGVVGCGGGGGTDGGSAVKTCSSDADCGTGSLCNTLGHVCMKSCTAGTDCPDTAKNCDVIAAATDGGTPGTSGKVCQCTTDPLCGTGSVFCSTLDKLCEVKCSDNSGCSDFSPARDCVTGQCLPSTPDAGTPDAGPGNTCTTSADCTGANAGKVCTGGQCVACSGTTSTDPQGSCDYSFTCASGACGAVAVGTCSAASSGPTWDKTKKGPEILSVSAVGSSTSDSTTECAGGGAKVEITVTFFAPQGFDDTTGMTDFVSKHVQFIDSNGNVKAFAFAHNIPAANATSGSFVVGVCGASSVTSAAMFMQNESSNAGNTVCFST